MSTSFNKIFGGKKPVIGMVHLKPLPGSPKYEGELEGVYEAALADLQALIRGGADAVIVENFGDIPYAPSSDLITYTAMSVITDRLRKVCPLPMGVNVQFNDWQAEWAIAYAAQCDFLRVEAFAENRAGPNGIFPACGPDLMRLKARFPRDVALLADVHVKHTFPLAEQPTDFTVESVIEGGADALICTGITTGKSPDIEDVRTMKEMTGCDFPVIVGSGVNADTAREFLAVADGAIIGSSFKKDGDVFNPIDEERVKKLMSRIG